MIMSDGLGQLLPKKKIFDRKSAGIFVVKSQTGVSNQIFPMCADPNACVIRATFSYKALLSVDGHDHRVVPVHAHGRRFHDCASPSALQQLSSDLWADGRVPSCEEQI